MEVLLGLIGVLAGWLFFERSRRKSAEALNTNLETKEELVKKDQAIANNNGSLASEEAKREDIAKNVEEAKKNDSIADVIDFLNRIDNNKQ